MIVLCLLVEVAAVVLLARLAMSWVPVRQDGMLASVNRALWVATEPVLEPVRSVLRPVQVGAMAVDLSPLVVLLALVLLTGFVCG